MKLNTFFFFILSARSPLPNTWDTRPTFRYVQVQPRKRALVLDTSGSMTVSFDIIILYINQGSQVAYLLLQKFLKKISGPYKIAVAQITV